MSTLPVPRDNSPLLTLTPALVQELGEIAVRDDEVRRLLLSVARASRTAGGARHARARRRRGESWECPPPRPGAKPTRETFTAEARCILEALSHKEPQTQAWLTDLAVRLVRRGQARWVQTPEDLNALCSSLLQVVLLLVVGGILPAAACEIEGVDGHEAVELVQLAATRAWGKHVARDPFYGPLVFRGGVLAAHHGLDSVMSALLTRLGGDLSQADARRAEAWGHTPGTFWERVSESKLEPLDDHVRKIRDQAFQDQGRARTSGVPLSEIRAGARVAASTEPPKDPVARAVDQELVDRGAAAITELPEFAREVLRLRAEEELSFREIAERLNTSHPRVARAYEDGLKVLRKLSG